MPVGPFPPLPSEPDVRISRIRSPVGSCNSHTERQFGAASSHRRSPAVPVALRALGSRKLHGFTAVPLSDAPPDLFTP